MAIGRNDDWTKWVVDEMLMDEMALDEINVDEMAIRRNGSRRIGNLPSDAGPHYKCMQSTRTRIDHLLHPTEFYSL